MPGLSGAQVQASPLERTKRLTENWRAKLDDHVIALAWSPDGAVLAAASVSGPIYILDAVTGRELNRFSGHSFGTTAVAWQPDKTILASAGQDGRIRMWKPRAGSDAVAELEGGADWVERLAWTDSGQYLASGAGRTLRLWDPEGRLVREYPKHPSTIADIAWKPNSHELACAGYGEISFWRPQSAEPIRRFEWKGSMLTIAWSPDGKYLSTGNQDSTVHFWIVASGKDLHMWGYPAKIRELAWDPDSRYLATGGSANVVVWDCSGKGPANTTPLNLELHDKPVQQLAYQKRGPLLASGCREGIVGIWCPAKAGALLGAAHLSPSISQLAWSPSEKMLAASTGAGDIVLLHRP